MVKPVLTYIHNGVNVCLDLHHIYTSANVEQMRLAIIIITAASCILLLFVVVANIQCCEKKLIICNYTLQ